ncbi:hypothetical protein DZ860_16785 [Vibrio sinensis]|uniref:Uncharacterized protein n=1 Tax=Vibrio sinensis TaxID=2302434 RepID=A0A3A6QBG0_9VIBR|nr:hypothetical protein [Vibrio sinensis]RJX68649.1 hypothetical protein DZ860_16785 [Vibrio sinensis]
MSDKKKGIAIGALVLAVVGIVGNLFMPKTSDLQKQSVSDVQIDSQPTLPIDEALVVETNNVQVTALVEPMPVSTIEQPSPSPVLYLEPLALGTAMAEHIQNVTKREIAQVKVSISELNAREWDAKKIKREDAVNQAIGLDYSPVNVVSVTTKAATVNTEPTLTLRGITGTAVEGQYAARLFSQGQFKRVEVGSRLSGYKITSITKESVTLKGKGGVHTLLLGESL